MSSLCMHVAGCTHIGQVRKRNEDCFELSSGLGMAVVCDGMGGHHDGAMASQCAVETIFDFIMEYDPEIGVAVFLHEPPPDDPGELAAALARRAVILANRRLHDMNEECGLSNEEGMGTTIVGAWMVEGRDQIVIFHVGDSRAYLIRNGDVTALTRDHSVWQVWADNGRIGKEPRRNLLTRALGVCTDQDATPDVQLVSVSANDVLILCSDGLHAHLSDARIGQIVVQALAESVSRNAEAMSRVAEALVEQANQEGGSDNITAAVALFTPF